MARMKVVWAESEGLASVSLLRELDEVLGIGG